ncbi:MAG: transcriptional repressor LexA [Peptostreptococcaceae bacterium]|nr:transcriptional repressor LexA [Peptostreptococcaceae bacterium]
MEALKDRERKILIYMKNQIKSKGYPPTVREICADLNIKSTSTTHKDIVNLEKKGYIRKDPSKPRALMIMDPDSIPSDEKPNSNHLRYNHFESNNVVEIPIIGRVAAGTPILAVQNIEDTFPVPSKYVGKGTNYMLTISGDSMIEVGILDGDLILVEQQNTARNGEIVVAMIDGMESEATVKTFYKEAGHIRLQPENSSMQPIIVKDVQILGKVKGVFRYFN